MTATTMNKYLTILVISVIASFSENTPAKAQVCGGGVFTFEFYTLNGEKIKNINYEIFPVNKENVYNIDSNLVYDLYRGTIINSEYVDRLINPAAEAALDKVLAIRGNKKKGVVKYGTIKFNTTELGYFACLLKLSSNKKDVYIVANLTGGCNRTTTILWNENPRIVR